MQRPRTLRRLATIALGLLLVALLTLLRAADPYPLVVARETVFDYYQQLKPRPDPDLPVTIVDIDEASLAAIGQWPWSRDILATLTNRLGELGAAVIAYDVLFTEPDRTSPSNVVENAEDYDASFAQALAEAPTVLAFSESGSQTTVPLKTGIAISGADPSAAIPALDGLNLPLLQLTQAASGLGAITLGATDAGTVVRNLPLLWRAGDTIVPALALEALRVPLGASTLVVVSSLVEPGHVEGVRLGPWTVPTSSTGSLRLYYRPLDPAVYVSAADILTGEHTAIANRIAGHIVLVGTSAGGLLDLRRSTLGVAVPGVSVHLQAIEQVMSGTYLHRADWVGGLEILVFAATGAILVLAVAFAGPATGLILSLVVAVSAAIGSWVAFAQYGLLLDATFLLLGAVLVYAAMAFLRFAVTDADRRRIRNAFAHYVAPSLLSEIERNAARLELGGETRELTVMFSDVRNSTALAERLPPPRLLQLLNGLFDALGGCITRESGTIDKFMGDAIMAFWNAPLPVEAHARRACTAALAMRQAVAAFPEDPEPVAIGIGLATGEALVGNMGSHERFDYSCIGETVNIAARVEDACKTVRYDILVTEATARAAGNFAVLPAGTLHLRGISAPQPVYLLVGDAELEASPRFRKLSECHALLCAALASGEGAADYVKQCLSLATGIEPGLAGFYQNVLARSPDFASNRAISAI
jgi:adenylate cyclase